jgi:hypothetical protein
MAGARAEIEEHLMYRVMKHRVVDLWSNSWCTIPLVLQVQKYTPTLWIVPTAMP